MWTMRMLLHVLRLKLLKLILVKLIFSKVNILMLLLFWTKSLILRNMSYIKAALTCWDML